MLVKESATESGTEYSFSSGCDSLFLVTFQEISVSGREGARDVSAFSFRLLRRRFLINLYAFTITGSEEVCDGDCF